MIYYEILMCVGARADVANLDETVTDVGALLAAPALPIFQISVPTFGSPLNVFSYLSKCFLVPYDAIIKVALPNWFCLTAKHFVDLDRGYRFKGTHDFREVRALHCLDDFGQCQHAMNMVRHDYELKTNNGGEPHWKVLPSLAHRLTRNAQPHFAIDDFTKNMAPLMTPNCDEIRIW